MGRGRPSNFPKDALQYLRDHASSEITRKEIMEMARRDLGYEISYQFVKHHCIKENLPFKKSVCQNRLMTDEQAEYMISIIPGRSSKEVTEMMNEKYGLALTVAQLRSWKKNHKIPSGYDARFRKGTTSHTKGRPWAEWMPPESAAHSRATQFTKGHIAKNSVPIGTISVRDGYPMIKVCNYKGVKNWTFYHRYVWEQHNGPVPKGYKILHLNGDRFDCSIENLRCVPDSVALGANGKFGWTEDPKINETILKAAELKIKISAAERKLNGKERG